MTDGSTSGGAQHAGMLPKRYDLKFIPGGSMEVLEWEDAEVAARVRKPGSADPVPVKRITKLEDDSNQVLDVPDPASLPPGLQEIRFPVNIRQSGLDHLKSQLRADPQGPIYTLSMEVEADPLAKTAMNAVLQMAAPAGLGAAAGAALQGTKVAGSSQIAIEFPHPFIWHQLMDNRFGYNGQTTFELDTNNDLGVKFGLNLREFSASGGGAYQSGQEILEVDVSQDGPGLLEKTAIEADGVRLKARRVLIADSKFVGNDENQPRLTPVWKPPSGSGKPPARNQADITKQPPKVRYKSYTLQAEVSIYRITPDNQEVLVQTHKGVEFGGEAIKVIFSGLPASFNGYIAWKITGKIPERYPKDFEQQGRVALSAPGQSPAAEIVLPKTGDPLTRAQVNLTVQVPLALRDLTLQISKMGWQTPEPITLSAADPRYTDFFQSLDQGASLTLNVPHALKETFSGLSVGDAVLYPTINVTGLLQTSVQVVYDSAGQPEIKIGSGEGAAGLDISDRVQPLQIDPSVLQPIDRLKNKSEETTRLLTAHEPGAKAVLHNGLKAFRNEYLKDYVELPEQERSPGSKSLAGTAEARRHACSCLALMMDACGKTPWLYSSFERNYAIAFRSAVSCCFATCIDTLLFFWSFAKSGPLYKLSEAAEEIPEDLAVRGAGELSEDGVGDTARAGADAAQDQLDEAARAGTRTAGEGAEDLSKLTARELEERLAAKKAEREAAEKALEELKRRNPNIIENETALSKLSKIADESLEQAKQAKEAVESQLDEIEKALKKSRHMQEVLKEAEGELGDAKKAYDALKTQKDDLTKMIDDTAQQAENLERQARNAKNAYEAVEQSQKELQKVADEAERSADYLSRQVDEIRKEIDSLTDDMYAMTEPGEINRARNLLNNLKSQARRLENTTIPNANKRLGSLKDKLSDMAQDAAGKSEAYNEALSEAADLRDQIPTLKKKLDDIAGELPGKQQAYQQTRHSLDAVRNEAAKLEPPSELVLQKRPLEKKLNELTDAVTQKTEAADTARQKAQEALEIVQDIQKKEYDTTARLPAEEARLRQVLEGLPSIQSSLGAELPKAEGDREHWLRRMGWDALNSQMLLMIPGIGQILLVWKGLPVFLEKMGMVTERLMRFIGWFLDNWDEEITAFARKVEHTLKKYQLKVRVQPVYGCKKDWVVAYTPRPHDKYLDKVNRAEVAQKGTKAVSEEGRQNRQTLNQQAMNNVLAGLQDSFDTACAYKSDEKQVYFTQQAYELAKDRIRGADQTFSRILEQEADSKIREDAAYGWNPLTLGFTTWNDYVRIIDWLGFVVSWSMRIAAVVGGVTSAVTVVGPITAAGVFLAADGVDLLKNGIKTIIALGGDANTKAKFLQLAVNYPCLAQGWLFKGMTEFTAQDLEAVNTWDGLRKYGPPPPVVDLSEEVKRLENRFNAL